MAAIAAVTLIHIDSDCLRTEIGNYTNKQE